MIFMTKKLATERKAETRSEPEVADVLVLDSSETRAKRASSSGEYPNFGA